MTAASTATKFLRDNRTVIGGKDDTGARIAILPTLPDGQAFVAKKGGGADATGTETAATSTVPAYVSSADVTTVVVPIDFATTGPGGGSKYVRKQFFKSTKGDPSTGKWCYVNKLIQPLDASGVPTTVAAAIDASTTPLTAVGQAMTNFAQPGPLPGVYPVSEGQQGYSRYLGWTVKQGPTGS